MIGRAGAIDVRAFASSTAAAFSGDQGVPRATEYRRYQAAAMRQRFAARFSGSSEDYSPEHGDELEGGFEPGEPDAELTMGTVPAPLALEQEMASYAIQDTAETVAKHYGRFLPKDKAALAAKILNKAWGMHRCAPDSDWGGVRLPMDRSGAASCSQA